MAAVSWGEEIITCSECGHEFQLGLGHNCTGASDPYSGDIFADLGLMAMLAAGLVAIGLGAVTLLVPIALWAEADGILRPILEALPLGSAVAETPGEDGQPLLIAVLAAVPVLAAAIALTRWRRGLVRRHLDGELAFNVVFWASLARMTAIVSGLSLIVVLASMAAGNDLGPDAAVDNPLSGAWPVLVAAAGWLAFSFFGLHRRITKERAKVPLPAAGPL